MTSGPCRLDGTPPLWSCRTTSGWANGLDLYGPYQQIYRFTPTLLRRSDHLLNVILQLPLFPRSFAQVQKKIVLSFFISTSPPNSRPGVWRNTLIECGLLHWFRGYFSLPVSPLLPKSLKIYVPSNKYIPLGFLRFLSCSLSDYPILLLIRHSISLNNHLPLGSLLTLFPSREISDLNKQE